MFKTFTDMTQKDKQTMTDMAGRMFVSMTERRDIAYIAKDLGLEDWQVKENIIQALWVLKRYVRKRDYIKILFWK